MFDSVAVHRGVEALCSVDLYTEILPKHFLNLFQTIFLPMEILLVLIY